MNNSAQLALFFDEGTIYNPAIISSRILNKFSEIGDPLILPINTGAPKEANIPIIVFNQNIRFQIAANFNNVIITLQDNNVNKLIEIATSIFDIFNKEKINFVRIGYLPTQIIDKAKKDEFRKKYLSQSEMNDVQDFQFSWFKKIKYSNIELNCWERSITDSQNFEGLLKNYDFNTNPSEKIIIDKKFLKNFIIFCNNYIKK